MFKNLLRTGNTDPYRFAIYIGFFAGLLSSIFRLVSHDFKFTQFDVTFLINDWFFITQATTFGIHILGVISLIFLSVLAAILYVLLFRKKQGPLWGLLYGIVWWGILFCIFPIILKWPTSGIVGSVETLIFECCFMTVWGLFIGYSITFEFTDEASYEPFYAKSSKT